MKIKLLTNQFLGNSFHEAGTVLDVTEEMGKELISVAVAEPVAEPEPEPEPEPEKKSK